MHLKHDGDELRPNAPSGSGRSAGRQVRAAIRALKARPRT
jgi:hypothetical protein